MELEDNVYSVAVFYRWEEDRTIKERLYLNMYKGRSAQEAMGSALMDTENPFHGKPVIYYTSLIQTK